MSKAATNCSWHRTFALTAVLGMPRQVARREASWALFQLWPRIRGKLSLFLSVAFPGFRFRKSTRAVKETSLLGASSALMKVRRGYKSRKSAEEIKDRRRREILERQRRDRRNFKQNLQRLLKASAGGGSGGVNDAPGGSPAAKTPSSGLHLSGSSKEPLLWGAESLLDAKSGGDAKAPASDAAGTVVGQGSVPGEMDVDAPEISRAKANYRRKRAARSAAAHARREFFARQLMYPEWMTDLPGDLGSGWLVMPRPEGTRCLVIASRGKTVSRTRSGTVLHQFASELPNGSHASRKAGGASVLDCVYQKDSESYFVLDVMCWVGYDVYESGTEFRRFWLRSKLAECPGVGRRAKRNRFRFVPAPAFQCTRDGLQSAYTGSHGYRVDGLLFIHKQTRYELGVTPLCLVWKDARTSRYFVDTTDGKTHSSRQQCTLHLSASGECQSLENTVVGRVPKTFFQETGARAETLHKFFIDGIVRGEDGCDEVRNLVYRGPASKARVLPDSWSKLVFQSQARQGTAPGIREIVDRCVATATEDSPSETASEGPVPIAAAAAPAVTKPSSSTAMQM